MAATHTRRNAGTARTGTTKAAGRHRPSHRYEAGQLLQSCGDCAPSFDVNKSGQVTGAVLLPGQKELSGHTCRLTVPPGQ